MKILILACILVHFTCLARPGGYYDYGFDDHDYHDYGDHGDYGYYKEVPGPSFLVKTVHHVSKLHHGGHLHGTAW